MTVFARIALAFGALALLSGCFVTPGKFVSTLDIRADRSFTFTYTGEIIAMDMDKLGDSGVDDTPLGEELDGQDSVYRKIAFMPGGTESGDQKKPADDFSDTKPAEDGKSDEAKMTAIAAALSKEKGFRSARYVGDNKFEVDYAISGTLTHSFVFPFNIDAKLVFPFIAIELRGDDRVRVKAPGYANSADSRQNPMGGSDPASEAAAQALDGTFTLTTNAVIVSQNQEDGPTTGAAGQTIKWKVDPLTTEAPMAVLRFPAK